jgi:hypothetical protein
LEFSDGLGTWFLAFFAFEIGVFTLAGWTGFRKYPHLRVFGEPFSRIILFLMLGPSMNSSAAVCVSRGTISIPTSALLAKKFLSTVLRRDPNQALAADFLANF